MSPCAVRRSGAAIRVDAFDNRYAACGWPLAAPGMLPRDLPTDP